MFAEFQAEAILGFESRLGIPAGTVLSSMGDRAVDSLPGVPVIVKAGAFVLLTIILLAGKAWNLVCDFIRSLKQMPAAAAAPYLRRWFGPFASRLGANDSAWQPSACLDDFGDWSQPWCLAA